MACSSSSQLLEALSSLKLEDTSRIISGEERHSGCEESKDEVMQDSIQITYLDPNIWSRMPDELLEKAFARLPLKALFQTRVLSKSWEAKLWSSSFRAEVSQVATKWDSYCPVYVGNAGLIGYNSASKCCERVLTLSYLPYRGAPLIPSSRGKLSVCGPLLSFVDLDQFPSIFVTNVITKRWKILPPRPNMNYPAIIHLFLVGFDAYKVLLITPLATPLATPCIQIYDSATSSWSIRYSKSAPEASTRLPPASSRRPRVWNSANNAWTDSTYFLNMLYVLWGYQHDGPCELLAYNVKEESWTIIGISALRAHLQPPGLEYFIPMSRILVCGNRVMIIVHLTVNSSSLGSSSPTKGKNNLVVFELFPDNQQIVEVTRSPPLELVGTDLNEAACDENCIYVCQRLSPKSSMVVYNIRQQEWSCLPSVCNTQIFHDTLKKRTAPEFFLQPATSSFQPGLNPFIPV